MNTIDKMSLSLGRIEAEVRGQRVETQNLLAEIRGLAERVRMLELWRARLKAIGTAVVALHAYLCRQAFRLGNLF